jgi:hypothetical protein
VAGLAERGAVSTLGDGMVSRLLTVFLFSVLFGAQAFAAGQELPPGPMKKKILATCIECHDTKTITKQRHDKKWWANTLEKMVGYGAQVDDSERPALLNYLSVNFSDKGAKVAAKKN